jgi:hypothetical protein
LTTAPKSAITTVRGENNRVVKVNEMNNAKEILRAIRAANNFVGSDSCASIHAQSIDWSSGYGKADAYLRIRSWDKRDLAVEIPIALIIFAGKQSREGDILTGPRDLDDAHARAERWPAFRPETMYWGTLANSVMSALENLLRMLGNRAVELRINLDAESNGYTYAAALHGDRLSLHAEGRNAKSAPEEYILDVRIGAHNSARPGM